MKRHPIALLALPWILVACGGGSPSPSEGSRDAGRTVEISDFDFRPDPVEIEVGNTVVWINRDDILHTITSGIGQKQGIPGVSKNKAAQPDGLFDSDMDGVGAEFSFAFEKKGTYRYFCSIHPGMRGVVVVR